MKKTLLTGLAALGVGIITALPFVGAADPLGVLFIKRVDTNIDNTSLTPGTNTVVEFDITNGYATPATIATALIYHMQNIEASNEEVEFIGTGFSLLGTRGTSVTNSPIETTDFSFATAGLTLASMETRRVSLNVTTTEGEDTLSQVSIKNMALMSGSGVYLSNELVVSELLSVGNSLDGALFNVSSGDTGSGSVLKVESDFVTTQTLKEDMTLTIDGSDQFDFAAQTILETPVADEIVGVTDGLRVLIPAGTTFTGSGSGLWDGTFDAPKVLGLPLSHDLPAEHNPLKRVSVGSPTAGINLSMPVTITIPVSSTGIGYVYSSQNGANWTYEKTCTITGGLCTFQTTHFTEFLVASLDTSSGNNNGASYSGHSSGGGQNTMRHGNYDPNNRAAQTIGERPEVKTVIFRRSAKNRRNYIPCKINEGADLASRFYNLKLSQGAPKACREDFVTSSGLPF